MSHEMQNKHQKVVVAGTFDRIHRGHEALLRKARNLTAETLYVGVTSDNMVKNRKLLWELIEPYEERIAHLKQYFADQLQFPLSKIVFTRIDDVYGNIFEIDADCLVVSRDTLPNARLINEEMAKRNLKTLHIVPVDLALQAGQTVSSTAARMALLGTLLRPTRIRPGAKVATIGLCGTVCAGKSHLAQFIASNFKNVHTINLDQLGHQTYSSPLSKCYQRLVAHFGSEIVNEDRTINRRVLGQLVFKDRAKMAFLERCTSRPIRELLHEKINAIKGALDNLSPPTVILVEGATILKARFGSFFDEVWSCILPSALTLERMQQYRNIDAETAKSILDNNLSTAEMVKESERVFCGGAGEVADFEAQGSKAMRDILNLMKLNQ